MVNNQTSQYKLLNKKNYLSCLGIFQYVRVILQYSLPLYHPVGGMKVNFSIGSSLLDSPIWCLTDKWNDCKNLWQESCAGLLWVVPFVLGSQKEQAFTLLSVWHLWCCFSLVILKKDFQHFEHLKSLLVVWPVLCFFRLYQDWNDLWPRGCI